MTVPYGGSHSQRSVSEDPKRLLALLLSLCLSLCRCLRVDAGGERNLESSLLLLARQAKAGSHFVLVSTSLMHASCRRRCRSVCSYRSTSSAADCAGCGGRVMVRGRDDGSTPIVAQRWSRYRSMRGDSAREKQSDMAAICARPPAVCYEETLLH